MTTSGGSWVGGKWDCKSGSYDDTGSGFNPLSPKPNLFSMTLNPRPLTTTSLRSPENMKIVFHFKGNIGIVFLGGS